MVYLQSERSGMISRIVALETKKLAREKRQSIIAAIWAILFFIIMIYLAIGICSLAEVSTGAGANISYSEFWHGPWSLLAGLAQ
jgi:hypothetical protein